MNTVKKASIIIALLGMLVPITVFGSESSRGQGRGRHQGPPPEAYSACEGKSAGDTAEFISPHGDTVTGTCEQEPDGDRLVLRPDNPPKKGPGGRPERNDQE